MQSVERWGIFTVNLVSSITFDQPFRDVTLKAYFQQNSAKKQVDGFYDGGSAWRIRFMPESEGVYTFRLESDHAEFNGLEGTFTCTPAGEGNCGPVGTKASHFEYADGSPCFILGTTAYAWTYRPEKTRRQTLESLAACGFNKVRMLLFPKYYRGSAGDLDVSYDPPVFPFAGESGRFDFRMLEPEYFRNFEDRVMDLMKLGIEADVILFHPYDRWGIDKGMKQEDDLQYVRYMIARLAAYRNVWWSLGNEYDISKTWDGRFCVGMDRKDWDLLGSFINANDPYGHLISNHNIPFGYIYPDRNWLTHVSYQHPDTYTLLLELKQKYNKPVVNDEYQYEGNTGDEWGNSTGELTLFRHWLATMAGGYASHGEVFKASGNNKDLFWAYGGTLIGESAPRLKFMKQLIETCPYQEMTRDSLNTDGHHHFSLSKGFDDYFVFCRYDLPGKRLWFGPYDGSKPVYEATVYDVWNCTVIEQKTVRKNSELQIKAWTAIRLIRREEDAKDG